MRVRCGLGSRAGCGGKLSAVNHHSTIDFAMPTATKRLIFSAKYSQTTHFRGF